MKKYINNNVLLYKHREMEYRRMLIQKQKENKEFESFSKISKIIFKFVLVLNRIIRFYGANWIVLFDKRYLNVLSLNSIFKIRC